MHVSKNYSFGRPIALFPILPIYLCPDHTNSRRGQKTQTWCRWNARYLFLSLDGCASRCGWLRF